MEHLYKMTYAEIKRFTGIFAIATPFIIIITGLLNPSINNQNWWHSLSASYYNSFSATAFISSFFILSFLLSLNKEKLSKIASLLLILIIVFPCTDGTIPISKSYVGLFKLSPSFSGKIHSIIALSLLIVMLIILVHTLILYKNKKLYSMLLLLIISMTILIIIENILHSNGNWSLHWTTIFSETILFICFGTCFYSSGLEAKLKISLSS